MAENAYDTLRRIEDFYTSRINHLVETGQDARAAELADELTEEFVADLRAALGHTEGRAA